MKKPLVKISNDNGSKGRPYPGQYRDTDGTPLHGIHTRQHSKTEDKLFIQNGNLMRKYKYPRIERTFRSVMVNDYNLHLCGGWSWSWPRVSDTECLTRVVSKLKPMGFLVNVDKEKNDQWLSYCQESRLPFISNCTGHESIWKDIYVLGLCVPGTFDENFDLEALTSDYCESAVCAGYDYLAKDIQLLTQRLKQEQIADYLSSDYAHASTLEELVTTGLILGYPIETTISILFME